MLFIPKSKRIYGVSAVITAAGESSRMGGGNKLFMSVGGAAVLERTIGVFSVCREITEIVVVSRECDMERVAELVARKNFTKVKKIVKGGSSRQESSFIGVMNVSPSAKLIAIHDAARPFVTTELISKVIKKASECGAAAPYIPLKDTVKIHDDGCVLSTPDRAKLAAVQTPQVFDADMIKAALTEANKRGEVLTDDCAALELLGMPVQLVEGSEYNIKITTPIDIKLGEVYLEMMENEDRTGL